MNRLKSIVNSYLCFVFVWEEDDNGKKWCEKTDDQKFEYYLENDFKFSAVNNWESGFDIVEWYEGAGDYSPKGHYKCFKQGNVSELFYFDSENKMSYFDQKCYDNNHYEDTLNDNKDFSPEMVLRSYAYTYLHELSLDDLREILSLPRLDIP